MASDTHLRRRARRAPRQNQLEQGTRDEHGGEHVRDQPEKERRREAANGTGAELEQEPGRDHRGDMGIDNRDEDAVEPGADRLARALPGVELLADSLED